MHRGLVPILAAILIFSGQSGRCYGQWGYGYYPYGYGGYGWGGWTGTVQGDIARGLGYFNMGAGIYNRETAVARAVNTDTAIRWNQFVYLSQKEANRHYHERRNAELANNRANYEALIKRLEENPTQGDIESGDALNAAVDQLSDPRIHTSALRMADEPIDAAIVRQIPFRNAVEAVTFSLSGLKNASAWPNALRGPRFANQHEAFDRLIRQAREESLDGEVTAETLTKIRELLADLKKALSESPLEGQAETEALKFIKTVAALVRLLEKPDLQHVLGELKNLEKVSLSSLLGFMHTFNLRFAPATTPAQREAYSQLFAILDRTRDRLLAEAKLDLGSSNGEPETNQLHDFFSAMDLDHIEGKRAPAK